MSDHATATDPIAPLREFVIAMTDLVARLPDERRASIPGLTVP